MQQPSCIVMNEFRLLLRFNNKRFAIKRYQTDFKWNALAVIKTSL